MPSIRRGVVVAWRMYFSTSSSGVSLANGIETGLFSKEQDGRYSYQPVNERFDEMVSLMLEAYHEHPSAVVQCLTTRAMSRVRVSLIRLTERLLERARS